MRDEIAATRADLGDTVEALAAKTDVKGRPKDAISDAADQAKQKVAAATDRAAQAAGREHERSSPGCRAIQCSLVPFAGRAMRGQALGHLFAD